MIVRCILGLLLAAPTFWLAMRYNVHMLQLNGYKNKEQQTWLKKNLRKEWVLVAGLLLALLRFFCSWLALDVLIYLWLLLDYWVFGAMKRIYSKKKLVFTARVKRLVFTNCLVAVAIVCATACTLGPACANAALILVVSVQFFAPIVSNLLNRPVELAINQHYINDAKRKLKAMPEMQIIGVTGSYGKTSVKFYLQTLLQEKYNVLVTPESFNTPMGVVRTVREHLKPTHEIFICEMGARHVGDIKELCDLVHPHHGVITSVGPQHLETFFSMENIVGTKFELADAVPAGGKLFLNGDNEYIAAKAGEYAEPIMYYAGEGVACGDVAEDAAGDDCASACADGEALANNQACALGYHAKDISVSPLGTGFTVVTPDGEEEHFQMRLVGQHNVINVVGAIAVAHQFGISLAQLRVPVRRIMPVPHRMELKASGAATIIDDAYNSNPVGSKAAVETLALFEGTKILITPGMVELGEAEAEYNYKFGTYAAPCCDYIFLVGKKHTEPIAEGIKAAGFAMERCKVFDHVEDAIAAAYALQSDEHKYILLENDLPDNY